MRRTLAALAVGSIALTGCTQPTTTPAQTQTRTETSRTTPATTGTTTTPATSPSTPSSQPSSNLPSIIMDPAVIIAELGKRGVTCAGTWREVEEGQGRQCANPKVWVYIDATEGELVSWMRENLEAEFLPTGGVTGHGNWLVGADAATWPRVKDI